jgi:hypothetical protein
MTIRTKGKTMGIDIRVVEAEWQKFLNYVDEIEGEVGAFGYVTEDENGFHVDEIFLVPQEASSASVEFMDEGLPYAIDKAMKDNRINDLRFCIHSHGNIPVGFSSDDEEMVGKMGSTGTPWFVSIVTNKEHKVYSQVDIFATGLDSIDHICLKDTTVIRELPAEEREETQADLKQFVKPAKAQVVKGSGTTGKHGTKGGNKHTPNRTGAWWTSDRAMDLLQTAEEHDWKAFIQKNRVRFEGKNDSTYRGAILFPDVDGLTEPGDQSARVTLEYVTQIMECLTMMYLNTDEMGPIGADEVEWPEPITPGGPIP